MLQNMKSVCTYETLPSCAQSSDSFADILPHRHKHPINLHGTMALLQRNIWL